MKYKINNKFVVDAKSPIEAAKAIKVIHQVMKDSVTEIAKDYNYKTMDSNIEDVTYICKLKDNCKYDMKTAIKLQNKLQAKGYNAKIMAPDIYVYDSVKDSYSYEDFEKDLEKMGIYNHTSTLYSEAKRGLNNLKRMKEISGGWWNEVDVEKVYQLANQVTDSVKDNDDIKYLSEEEEQAIEDYKEAIANTKDPKLLNLFAHILKEEIEHLEELQNSEEEVIDSCKK